MAMLHTSVELSSTGTHLNLVQLTAGEIESSEAAARADAAATEEQCGSLLLNKAVEPVTEAVVKVKSFIDAHATEMVLPANQASDASGNLVAPALADDPWNADPGPWNKGRSTKPYGSKRRQRLRVAGPGVPKEVGPADQLPIKKLLGHTKPNLEEARAVLRSKLALHAGATVDENGQRAVWDEAAAAAAAAAGLGKLFPFGKDSKGHPLPPPKPKRVKAPAAKMDPVGREWKAHLAATKASYHAKRKENLSRIQPYMQGLEEREQKERQRLGLGGNSPRSGNIWMSPRGDAFKRLGDKTGVAWVDEEQREVRLNELAVVGMRNWSVLQVAEWVRLCKISPGDVGALLAAMGIEDNDRVPTSEDPLDGEELFEMSDKGVGRLAARTAVSLCGVVG